MRKSIGFLSAAALMAAAGGGAVTMNDGRTSIVTGASVKNGPAQTNAAAPGDTKAAFLGTGYVRRNRAPRGKRYSASVRQHQRHATKRRNRIKSKA